MKTYILKYFLFALLLLLLSGACTKDKLVETGTLDLNFQLQYGDTPLVMFEKITYPEPEIPVILSLVSAYISNIILLDSKEETLVLDIDRLRIEENQNDMGRIVAGTTLSIPSIRPSNFTGLKFGIGVPKDLNAKTPMDFLSDHPLSHAGEYWASWGSYIFFRIEGWADTDNDGFREMPIALHGGSDEAFREKDFIMDFSVKPNQTTTLVFTINLKAVFDNNGIVYDLVEMPQIHSLNQLDQTNELADNIVKAIQ